MPESIELVIKDYKEKCDSPSLKAFREYMCNKYHVKSVDDIDISTKEYAEYLTVFEVLDITDELKEMIMDGKQVMVLKKKKL